VWISKVGKSFNERLLWEIEAKSDYVFLDDYLINRVSGTLSWEIIDKLSTVMQLSGFQEEGKDRDQGYDIELSVNYDF
jgi:hypothetical protein